MGRLDGKVAIITGGSSGIGKASAILFAKEGARVLVSSRTTEKLQETVQTIKAAGGEASFTKTDVSNEEDVKQPLIPMEN